jgi:hypothetical protein
MWQPAQILYPDAELVLCDKTRELLADQDDVYIGRTIPKTWAKAITWNRIGGTEDAPFDTAMMECRIWAPTDQQCMDLARLLQARLPGIYDGAPVIRAVVVGGPTDLGIEDSPMRQLLYNITIRGTQHATPAPIKAGTTH